MAAWFAPLIASAVSGAASSGGSKDKPGMEARRQAAAGMDRISNLTDQMGMMAGANAQGVANGVTGAGLNIKQLIDFIGLLRSRFAAPQQQAVQPTAPVPPTTAPTATTTGAQQATTPFWNLLSGLQ